MSPENDTSKKLEALRSLAESGDAQAQFELGLKFYKGEEVALDAKVAFTFWKKSADQGHAFAQNNLSILYAQGDGVTRSDAMAFFWCKKSAIQGNAYGQLNLGKHYAKGIGVKIDNDAAEIWLTKAAAQGNSEALNFMMEINTQQTADDGGSPVIATALVVVILGTIPWGFFYIGYFMDTVSQYLLIDRLPLPRFLVNLVSFIPILVPPGILVWLLLRQLQSRGEGETQVSDVLLRATPSPLPNYTGRVGGIESLTMDGRRYYFGFDYKNDAVLSPLIADIDVMASYAHKYMMQSHGSAAIKDWLAVAKNAIENSGYTRNESSQNYRSEFLAQIASDTDRAQKSDVALAEFNIDYDLRYLLDAAREWEEPTEKPTTSIALQKLNIDIDKHGWEYIDEAVAYLNSSKKLPTGATYSDAAIVIQDYFESAGRTMHGNWALIFSPLLQRAKA
jgi:hypothetical protein